jgi:hypothetical protein
MFINRGWAVPLVVLLIVLVSSALVEVIAESITNNKSFYQEHNGAVAIALLISAAICWQLGRKLNRAEAATSDGRTKRREFVGRSSHLRSSVTIGHWAFILVIIASFLLLQAFIA